MTDNVSTLAGEGQTGDNASALTVENNSRLGRMFWIGFYTTLLNIVTLTIFRFWGRTHFRRQLWADTKVGGEPLEYTGQGKELFIGFIIAIFTFMLPYLGVIYLAQVMSEQPLITGLIFLIVYMVLFFIIGVAIFLARRYHLSRTRLRGIRFAQDGSARGYGVANFGYILITGLTFGWYGPQARINLSRRMWDNTWFGDQKFTFTDTPEAKAEPVYKSFAVSWFGAILVYFGAIGAFVAVGLMDPEANIGDDPASITAILWLYAIIIVAGFIWIFFASWHEAVMIRRIMKSLKINGVSIGNKIKLADILELSITNTLLIIFTLGIGVMPAQMRLWKRIANSITTDGSIDFSTIKQSRFDTPTQAEGLADGLDLISNF